MGYIEPCCANKQLPKLLRDKKGKVCVFQTSGDVTLQKVMDAVSFMAGKNHELVLMLPKVDVKILRHVKRYVVRGWSTNVKLLLGMVCGMTDVEIMAALEGTGGKVLVFFDEMVKNGMVVFSGDEGTVVVQGDLLSEVDAGLKLYAGYFGSDEERIKDFCGAVLSKIRVKIRHG